MNHLFCLLIVFLVGFFSCHRPMSESQQDISSVTIGEAAFEEYIAQKKAKFRGMQAPDFEVYLLNGKKQRLSELKGQVLLLNFWFTGCKPCEVELPSLKELHSEFASKGLVILAAGLDNAEKAAAFVQKHQLKFEVIPDAGELAKLYEVSSYPTNVLIDKDGRIKELFIGASDFDATHTYFEVKPHLQSLLN